MSKRRDYRAAIKTMDASQLRSYIDKYKSKIVNTPSWGFDHVVDGWMMRVAYAEYCLEKTASI